MALTTIPASLSATALTLTTAAQPNITSVGTLTGLTVSGDLTIDTSTLVVDATNNRVGIGTSSPTYKLNVLASSGSQNIFQAGQSGISNGLSITSNGSALTYSFLTGNVGIGTSSPNNTLSILGSVNQLDIETTTTGVTVESIDRSDLSAQSDLSFYARNGEHKFFGAAYSERMRIDASGNLILKKNLVLESTSEGIDFSGVGASAQTLDDYEEGTWTMGLGTTSSGFSASITNTTGTYTKVGNTVNVRIYTGAVNVTSAGSGTALITGLPFTVSNSGNANSNYSAASFAHTNLFSTTYEGYGAIGQNYVVVVQVGTISTATFATGNGKYMMFTLTYKTDA